MLEAASLLKLVLDKLEVASFPKTSGRTGLNINVPLTKKHSQSEAKGSSKPVAERLAEGATVTILGCLMA